jgi:PKD domain-containing protein
MALTLLCLPLIFAQTAHAGLLPSFTASPLSPLTGETVTFVSTSTGVTEPETWDLDRDGNCDDATGNSVQRTFPVAGDYTVKLCVSDGDQEKILRRTITVQNRPPVAAFSYAPGSPVAGDGVTLTSTSFDPDGPIVELAWDLDNDGAFEDASGVSASVSFAAAGSYTVGLLARDRDGAAVTALRSIAVAIVPQALVQPPAPRPPRQLLVLLPIVRVVAAVNRRGTRIRNLIVGAPAGSRVMVRCLGPGCPFRRSIRSVSSQARQSRMPVRASKLVRIQRLRGRTLRPGAVLEIWITRNDSVGKYTRFAIRKRRAPRRQDLCVMPGAAEPVACPDELSARVLRRG